MLRMCAAVQGRDRWRSRRPRSIFAARVPGDRSMLLGAASGGYAHCLMQAEAPAAPHLAA
jgi:hypothetical protein